MRFKRKKYDNTIYGRIEKYIDNMSDDEYLMFIEKGCYRGYKLGSDGKTNSIWIFEDYEQLMMIAREQSLQMFSYLNGYNDNKPDDMFCPLYSITCSNKFEREYIKLFEKTRNDIVQALYYDDNDNNKINDVRGNGLILALNIIFDDVEYNGLSLYKISDESKSIVVDLCYDIILLTCGKTLIIENNTYDVEDLLYRLNCKISEINDLESQKLKSIVK